MNRAYYSDSIERFLTAKETEILGRLTAASEFDLEQAQRDVWLMEVAILQPALARYQGTIHFELSIPRMGSRIDVVLLIGPVIFVLEFKIGKEEFDLHALDQVVDYALDLKNFHEPSHNCLIAPILIATKAIDCAPRLEASPKLPPIRRTIVFRSPSRTTRTTKTWP